MIELRRIPDLPPYAFAEIDALKLQLRRDGVDVIDLGFGNPDIASPEIAVAKLAEAAAKPRNHRYSASRGIPNLRQAICELYERRFGVDARPGARGDHDDRREGGARAPAVGARRAGRRRARAGAELPDPHVRAGLRRRDGRAGGDGRRTRTSSANLADAYERSAAAAARRDPSFPHNPTTTVVDADFMQALVDFARERELVVVHDFAYADIAFDGHEPPSILAAEGAKDVAVELYTLTKGFSMAGWRVGFCVGNAEVVAGARRGSSRTSTTARSSRSRSPRR